MKYIIFSFILISSIYSQSTILEEVGYILAMEATFVAMSLASTQDDYYGHYVVGGFDSFMAYSGVMHALVRYEEVPEYKGMFLIATGFLLKAIYNFQSAKIEDKNKLFWINFISYNFLVFSGYYITENFGVE